MRVLIVEDDEGLQRQLRWAYDDYEVLIASDREAALTILRAEEPAVVGHRAPIARRAETRPRSPLPLCLPAHPHWLRPRSMYLWTSLSANFMIG